MMTRILVAALAFAALAILPAQADWTASGSFQFTDRNYSISGFTTPVVRPVRIADVQIYDADTGDVLANGFTTSTGEFTTLVPDAASRTVAVRVLTSTDQNPSIHISVIDDFVSPEAIFTYHDAATDVASHSPTDNVDFGSITMPIATGVPAFTDWSSQAFNIFDCGLMLADWIASVDIDPPAVPLVVGWNPTQSRVGSFYINGDRVYLADTDGYCDSVILHEMGHFVEDHFGFSTNTGGPHTLSDDDQDLRLSWSEGFASFINGATLHFEGRPSPHLYLDRNSFDPGPGDGFSLGYEGSNIGGAANEFAVTGALYDMVDNAGAADTSPGVDDDPLSGLDSGIWDVLEEMRDREPLATTMETFWDFWFELGLGNDADMRTVFASERLDFFPDPYEPNDLIEQAVAAVFGVPYGITFYRAGPTAGGDQDWFRFDAEAGEDYHILIEGVPDLIFGRPDPEMFVIDAVNGLVIAHSDEQCDSSTNTQGSSSAQDMSETTPSIRFRAPATQTYHILLRHDSDAINLTHRYGSCRLYVNHAAPPAPDIVRSSAQLMRPGQSYRVALCAEEAFVDATFTASDAGITISDVHPRGAGMFDMLATVAPEVPDGIYSVTLTNPDGTSDTRVGVIRVNAANAEPELVISEIQITEPNQIEITNIGTADADLTGWQIQARSIFFAGVQLFTFPEFSLAPGATVVVSDADGVNTATELFDTGNTFDWLLESGGGGDVRLIDDLFGLADQVRWVRRVVDFQWSLAGVWMQPEILTTSAGTFSRHLPSGRKWSTDALSVAMASMPAGASGRENLVDAFEPNENPRDVPILIPDVLLEDLAIHPKPEELEEGADEDWFGVLLQTGDSLRATIAFTHADGNLDMEIYAPGEESTPLAVSSTTTDGEFITLPAADITTNGGGIYRIRIFGPDFSTNAYSLHLSDGTKTAQDVIDYLVRRTTDPTGLEFNGQPGIDAADLVTAIVQEN